MPRFAANIGWLFAEHAFLERFRAAREAGFAAVEFAAPYEHPAEELARRLREHALECILVNLPMGDKSRGDFGIACRPGREEEFRLGVERALEYAGALGVARMNCIAGTLGAADDRARCERTLVANLRFAARRLAEAGVELVIEPINSRDAPGFIVPTAAEAVRIIDQVDEPNLGLQCDLYHTAMMGDDPSSILSSLRGIIRHVQFADVPGRGEPGTGRLPFSQLFDTLEAMRYDGWVSAEYKPSRPTPETLAWMQEYS